MQQFKTEDTAVLIPSYKPDHRLPPYIEALRQAGVAQIVVVDDGSGENYRAIFDAIPQGEGVHVIHYTPNGGKGVALKRGMQYLEESCPEARYIVTADSDGQHTVADVLRMFDALREDGEGLLLGSRDFAQAHVPKKSRMGNRITTVVFCLLYGRWVRDTQTGLRGFTRNLLSRMIATQGDRYEYEMNMLIDCATHGIPIRALPIETVYENNNEGSHFRAVRDSARIYGVIFGGFLRFISTSLACFLVDYGMYRLLNDLLRGAPALGKEIHFLFFRMLLRILVATVVARLVSGTLNFFLNRRFVFASKHAIHQTFPRYLCVFFLIMALSAILTSTLHLWTGFSDNAVKIPVDIALFLLSFQLQQKWVFAKNRGNDLA